MNNRRHARLRAHQRARRVGKLWDRSHDSVVKFAELCLGHEISDWQKQLMAQLTRTMDRDIEHALLGGASGLMGGTFANTAQTPGQSLTLEKLQAVCREFAPPKRWPKRSPVRYGGFGGIIDPRSIS